MCLYLILQKCKYIIVDLVSLISQCPFFFSSSVKPFKNLLYTIEARAEVRVALGHHNTHPAPQLLCGCCNQFPSHLTHLIHCIHHWEPTFLCVSQTSQFLPLSLHVLFIVPPVFRISQYWASAWSCPFPPPPRLLLPVYFILSHPLFFSFLTPFATINTPCFCSRNASSHGNT